ncbi:MAG: hypothetical protein AVDCRST_MAG56-4715 [uncultured Cytophagales bacterium]|uniref:Uncharacterized protein n=1 Tax=uncultured Cytophagales bacterium TaxID=158755 RepID=A0A6J4K085_9SPHI|nr:MAG: hypothetical protein AVDCRST_MAG56-4715 [uncultured Cytophagales bacterium]
MNDYNNSHFSHHNMEYLLYQLTIVHAQLPRKLRVSPPLPRTYSSGKTAGIPTG